MTKTYTNDAKDFVNKVLRLRKSIENKPGNYVPQYIKNDIPNIEHAMTTINDNATMNDYLLRKKSFIQFLIPANKISWQNQFNQLLKTK